MTVNLEEPLSSDEIDELSDFLLSDAMPDEGMDIVALDGFLTAMVIGPAPLPADAWLPLICGGQEPVFDSEEQVEWFTEQILRLATTIGLRLAADPPAFEPILYAEEVEGETRWIADSWCNGFMQVIESGTAEWLPFFENPSNAELLAPMITLATPEGDDAPDAAPDAAKIDLYVEMLGPCVLRICEFWRMREQAGNGVRPRAARTGRNAPCPCGSGRKFKRCCAA
jgi:uncharacterized protein